MDSLVFEKIITIPTSGIVTLDLLRAQRERKIGDFL